MLKYFLKCLFPSFFKAGSKNIEHWATSNKTRFLQRIRSKVSFELPIAFSGFPPLIPNHLYLYSFLYSLLWFFSPVFPPFDLFVQMPMFLSSVPLYVAKCKILGNITEIWEMQQLNWWIYFCCLTLPFLIFAISKGC